MAQMILNEVWQLRIGAYTVNQASINTSHFKVTGIGGLGATDTVVAEAFNDLLGALYRGVLSDDAFYHGVSLQRVFPLPRTRPATFIPAITPGAVAGEILPGQVSGIIRLRTAFAGHSHRGRVYLPFPSEAHNEVPGLPTPEYVQAGQLLASTWFAGRNMPGAGPDFVTLQPVIFHRISGSTDEITTADCRKLWATQKRRGSYGRTNLSPF